MKFRKTPIDVMKNLFWIVVTSLGVMINHFEFYITNIGVMVTGEISQESICIMINHFNLNLYKKISQVSHLKFQRTFLCHDILI